MERINICHACQNRELGIKTRIALPHTCGGQGKTSYYDPPICNREAPGKQRQEKEKITAHDIIMRYMPEYSHAKAVSLILRFTKEMEGEPLKEALTEIMSRARFKGMLDFKNRLANRVPK